MMALFKANAMNEGERDTQEQKRGGGWKGRQGRGGICTCSQVVRETARKRAREGGTAV